MGAGPRITYYQVIKWGKGIIISIPHSVASQLNLQPDLPVNVGVSGDDLIISPIYPTSETLHQLLGRITDSNRHEEVDFGPPVGKEVW